MTSKELGAAVQGHHQPCLLPHSSWDAASPSREGVVACPEVATSSGMGTGREPTVFKAPASCPWGHPPQEKAMSKQLR